MVAPSESAVAPPEGWERARDRLRSGLAAVSTRIPLLARARIWALWGAVILLLAIVLIFPRYRGSLGVYIACFWILIVWFALTRTKTIGWAGVARMFSVAVAWSWVIAWASVQLAGSVDLRIRDDGPGTAIAALTEESLKLVPVIALALIAPGRVRRFAAVDWLLLSLAAGLGFQAWEDLLRRLTQAVLRPGLLDLLTGDGPGSGLPQYGWGPLSGGSGKSSLDDVYGYAGHHVFTALVGASVGLGIAAWRHSNRTSSLGITRRWGWRVAAVALPVLAWCLVVVNHFGYNAILNDGRWLEGDTSAPWLIRATWSTLGKGTGTGWLLLLLLLACFLVDAARLHASGPATDLPAGTDWLHRPRLLVDNWVARMSPALRWRPFIVSLLALVVHVGRDLTVITAAHARDSQTEPRRAALLRGRASASMLRQVRGEALGLTIDDASDPVRFELRARRRVRLIALGALAVVLFTGLILAAHVARGIGTDLTPDNSLLDWLAGQFDRLGRWWAARSGAEKILIGAGLAALIALSGGSLGLAFGISGALTYTAEHARGAASFTRDPAAATRSWLDTTTPAGAALDLAEFFLTFAPGNFAGAAAGRGVRSAVREYLDDPAAFVARRRAAMRGDGSSGVPGRRPDAPDSAGSPEVPGRRQDPPERATGSSSRSWPDDPAPGTPEHDLGWDPAVKRFRPAEYRTATRVMDEYNVTLSRAQPGQPFDWVDEAGRSYDAVGGFPGQFLDRQWDTFTGQIVRHLDKADLIPVDVSQFSPEQIARVREFIAPLGNRVFIVGG